MKPESIKIRVLPPSLYDLDKVEGDILAAYLVAGQRPPHGIAGLCDWRLMGFISRLIAEGKLSGETGEKLLISSEGSIIPKKLVIYGVGDYTQAPLSLQDTAAELIKTLKKLGAVVPVIAWPQGDFLRMPLSEAIAPLISELKRAGAWEYLVCFGDVEGWRNAVSMLPSHFRIYVV